MSPVRSRQIYFVFVCCAIVSCVSTPARAQEPERVTLCQLQSDPAAFNRHVVEVTAFASHGFEDFTLFDPTCSSSAAVWLEYGGTVDSGAMTCCGVANNRKRPAELAVENIPVPLVDDELFQQFDQLMQRPPEASAHATFVGRFFSGRLDEASGSQRGYGHLGCCSLLAIEQVVAVDPQTRSDLDYGPVAEEPKIENKAGCGVRDLLFQHVRAERIDAQRHAEAGEPPFAFDDPDRVGAGSLAALLQVDAGSITHFKRTHEAQGRVTYEWKGHGDTPNSYMVVVSKPYWLSFYAKDPNKVAWVVIAAYESSCGLVNQKHGHFPL
jgi:hypothetical protein